MSGLSRAEEISLVPPLIVVLVALFACSYTFAIQRWRFTLDRLNSAVDNLAAEVGAAADIATEYWLIDLGETCPVEDRRKSALLEPKLVGHQTKLEALLLAVVALDYYLDLTLSREQLVTLFDCMTGGSFKGANRSADPDRAQMVQMTAATLVGELRAAAAIRNRAWFGFLAPRRNGGKKYRPLSAPYRTDIP